jgi:hypothetical protein
MKLSKLEVERTSLEMEVQNLKTSLEEKQNELVTLSSHLGTEQKSNYILEEKY